MEAKVTKFRGGASQTPENGKVQKLPENFLKRAPGLTRERFCIYALKF